MRGGSHKWAKIARNRNIENKVRSKCVGQRALGGMERTAWTIFSGDIDDWSEFKRVTEELLELHRQGETL